MATESTSTPVWKHWPILVRFLFRSTPISFGWAQRTSAGNFQAAVEAADRLIRFRPDKSNAYRFKAAALGHLGRIEEANKALTKAIEISPQNFDYFVRKRPTWMRAVDHDLQIEGLKKAGLPKQ